MTLLLPFQISAEVIPSFTTGVITLERVIYISQDNVCKYNKISMGRDKKY